MSDEELKQCSKCLRVKPIDEFRYLTAQGRYQAQCLECERKYALNRRNRLLHRVDKLYEKKRSYAIRTIINFIETFGEGVIEDAKRQRNQAPWMQRKDAR